METGHEAGRQLQDAVGRGTVEKTGYRVTSVPVSNLEPGSIFRFCSAITTGLSHENKFCGPVPRSTAGFQSKYL